MSRGQQKSFQRSELVAGKHPAATQDWRAQLDTVAVGEAELQGVRWVKMWDGRDCAKSMARQPDSSPLPAQESAQPPAPTEWRRKKSAKNILQRQQSLKQRFAKKRSSEKRPAKKIRADACTRPYRSPGKRMSARRNLGNRNHLMREKKAWL
jgi:hypothetical protein